jgi:hypothetical protein
MGWYGPDLQAVDISKWGKVSINNAIVDADVAMDTVGPQRHLAEILHRRRLRMRVVGDGARDDLSVLGAGEPMVDLVAGHVGDDAPGSVPVVEPVRTSFATRDVGSVTLRGPSPRVCTTRPIRPSRTNCPALLAQRTSKRSEKVTDQNRPDCVTAFSIWSSWSSVTHPGLSVTTSLPLVRASTAIAERWSGTAAVTMTSIEGSRSRLVWSSIHLTSGQRRRTVCDGRSGVLGAEPDELTALIEQTLDLPESMCMVQADGGKPNWRTALVCCAH